MQKEKSFEKQFPVSQEVWPTMRILEPYWHQYWKRFVYEEHFPFGRCSAFFTFPNFLPSIVYLNIFMKNPDFVFFLR